MWERTITIGSAGKAFSVTGWKLGWAYGPENLIKNLQIVHQNCVGTCPTHTQEATAIAIEHELGRLNSSESFFRNLAVELEGKRDFITNTLKSVGMIPTVPQGGYFIIADWSHLENKVDLSTETDPYKDYRFTKWMTKNIGLQGIPPTAFYSTPNKSLAENLVRFCFIKKDETLEDASDILENWFGSPNRKYSP
jgi:kynurenine--oxoglutarate transaminase/cysteine-S-conjugate beta-lyase/glutamine--phenylpyruvate transaminase